VIFPNLRPEFLLLFFPGRIQLHALDSSPDVAGSLGGLYLSAAKILAL
jgi:hypothetical protein